MGQAGSQGGGGGEKMSYLTLWTLAMQAQAAPDYGWIWTDFTTMSEYEPLARSAGVFCFDQAGNRADSQFVALYQSHGPYPEDGFGAAAYLWAHDPVAPSYTPTSTYRYSSGGDLTVQRLGTGRYQVRMELWPDGGVPLVTAYGPGSERCKADGVTYDWATSELLVGVRCFAGTAPADTTFTFSYSAQTGLVSPGWAAPFFGAEFLYQGAHASTSGTAWSADATGVVASIEHTGTGSYTVIFEDVGQRWGYATTARVTADGPGSEHCRVSSWFERDDSDGKDDTHVRVSCHTAAGLPVDTSFHVLFQSDDLTARPMD
jgi:hypothetical protein